MPKENRKQIILQSLASLLEERNLSKVTTALLAEKSSITLEEIGNMFNVTRMRICQIEKKALAKIRSMVLNK